MVNKNISNITFVNNLYHIIKNENSYFEMPSTFYSLSWPITDNKIFSKDPIYLALSYSINFLLIF